MATTAVNFVLTVNQQLALEEYAASRGLTATQVLTAGGMSEVAIAMTKWADRLNVRTQAAWRTANDPRNVSGDAQMTTMREALETVEAEQAGG
jgi:hypothetical protein